MDIRLLCFFELLQQRREQKAQRVHGTFIMVPVAMQLSLNSPSSLTMDRRRSVITALTPEDEHEELHLDLCELSF